MAKRKKLIPDYGTTVIKGVEYYRTRIEDADGKRDGLTEKKHPKSAGFSKGF